MISKLIAFGSTRAMAIERMLRALDEYHVGGIATNVRLFRRILRYSDFRAGKVYINDLEPLLTQFRLKAERELRTPGVARAGGRDCRFHFSPDRLEGQKIPRICPSPVTVPHPAVFRNGRQRLVNEALRPLLRR